MLAGPDPLAKSTVAIPSAFNQAGQAAGYASNTGIGQHACFWNNDTAHSIVDLGTLPGDWSSLAWAINGYGQTAGETHPPFGSRPVIWNNDPAHTATELTLLAGDNYGTAVAINNLGQVLGWSGTSEPGTWNVGPGKLVVWRDGEVFDLQALLDPATATNWTLTIVRAINSAGQIVGSGTRNGVTHGILLTPVAP